MEDPAQFAAQALRTALEQRGVAVSGSAIAEHLYPDDVADLAQAPEPRPPAGIELARHVSAPLIEDLRITAKVSQNLHAELALRAVGRARRNVGSFEAGMAEMKTFLAEAGIDPAGYNLMDGSGLSRLDLVTPSTVLKLLRYMYAFARAREMALHPPRGRAGWHPQLAFRRHCRPPAACTPRPGVCPTSARFPATCSGPTAPGWPSPSWSTTTADAPPPKSAV